MRSIWSFFIFVVILLFAVAILLSYFDSSNDLNPVTGKDQKLFMDITEESLLGGLMQESVINRSGGLCRDQEATAVMMSAGRKISKSAVLENAPWNFSFYMLSDSTTAGLYACPDGSVLITKGLYDMLVTEDQLAAVLSHGIGHVVSRHTTVFLNEQKNKGVLDVTGLRRLVEKAGRTTLTPEFEQLLCDRPHSATEEIEADQLAAEIMKSSGYDSIALLEVVRMFRGKLTDSHAAKFVEMHPLHIQRMDALSH